MSIETEVYVRDPTNDEIYKLGNFPSRNKAAAAIATWLEKLPAQYHFDVSTVKSKTTWATYLGTPKGAKVANYVWLNGNVNEICPFLQEAVAPVAIKPGLKNKVMPVNNAIDSMDHPANLCYSKLYETYLYLLELSREQPDNTIHKKNLAIKECYLKEIIWRYYHQKLVLDKLSKIYGECLTNGKHPDIARLDLNVRLPKASEIIKDETLVYPLVPDITMDYLEELLFYAETQCSEYCNINVPQLSYLRGRVDSDGAVFESHIEYITIASIKPDDSVNYSIISNLVNKSYEIVAVDPKLLVISNKTGKLHDRVVKTETNNRRKGKKAASSKEDNLDEFIPPKLEPIPSNCQIKLPDPSINVKKFNWSDFIYPVIKYREKGIRTVDIEADDRLLTELENVLSIYTENYKKMLEQPDVDPKLFDCYINYLARFDAKLLEGRVPINTHEVMAFLERIDRELRRFYPDNYC